MEFNQDAIKKVKKLIKKKGFIYAFLMAAFEDMYFNIEDIGDIDHRNKLSVNEVGFLFGFLVQSPLNFDYPETPQDLIKMKDELYQVLKELHDAFLGRFSEMFSRETRKDPAKVDMETDMKSFFSQSDLLVEAIFYSGTGAYDFQYAEYLQKKYMLDEQWLMSNKNFDIIRASQIPKEMKDLLERKAERVNLVDIKSKLPEVIGKLSKKNPNEDFNKHGEGIRPMLELYQYVRLFSPNSKQGDFSALYDGLLDLFTITEADFSNTTGVRDFLNNFSFVPNKNTNKCFNDIGNYNIIMSHPLIKLESGKYLLTSPFLLFQSVYESPYYWMMSDKKYLNTASKNRGDAGEKMVFDMLSEVFPSDKLFQSVTVQTKKGTDDTDIDVLAILGTKALCIQVKSKKLTNLARSGRDEDLANDFKGAVQDAYEQGIISREKVLKNDSKFIDSDGKEIVIPDYIDEAYIMVVTTENFPSLTGQARFMLKKEEDNPFPLVLTMFDLELLAFYLSDPYDFLYYVRQRIALTDYFYGDEEIAFLSHHLTHKLWRDESSDMGVLDTSIAQAIDRNYYPIKAGISVSSKGDDIATRWKNDEFEAICKDIKSGAHPKATDVVFNLLDWSGDAREDLVKYVQLTKSSTARDGKTHNFVIPPTGKLTPKVGLTYVSFGSDDIQELSKKLLTLCQLRKYKSKGDVWIGLGSLKNSKKSVDVVVYMAEKWKEDTDLAEVSEKFFDSQPSGRPVRLGKKIGRNDPCPCGLRKEDGSRQKYKKCCGK